MTIQQQMATCVDYIKGFLSNESNIVREFSDFVKEHFPDAGGFNTIIIECLCRPKACHKRCIIINEMVEQAVQVVHTV